MVGGSIGDMKESARIPILVLLIVLTMIAGCNGPLTDTDVSTRDQSTQSTVSTTIGPDPATPTHSTDGTRRSPVPSATPPRTSPGAPEIGPDDHEMHEIQIINAGNMSREVSITVRNASGVVYQREFQVAPGQRIEAYNATAAGTYTTTLSTDTAMITEEFGLESNCYGDSVAYYTISGNEISKKLLAETSC
jgi:hypothetical protein